MGQMFEATCQSCRKEFVASEGGGFAFESLRCAACGEATAVSFERIGTPYLAYLKGLNCVLPEPNGADGQSYPGEPIGEAEYHRAVEAIAGACECGGRFTFDAPLRCPTCRSDQIERGRTTMHFD